MPDYAEMRSTLRDLNARFGAFDGAACLTTGCSGAYVFDGRAVTCRDCGRRLSPASDPGGRLRQ